ncbi:MAG TPA: DUF6531 domain-containing protein [Burkholderiales bacterium]|nr:DUF6531 domain-containing protein [Burkholderiales bacterium]
MATSSAARVVRLVLLFSTLSLAGIAQATNLWEAHSGDPHAGIPPENYKYLDANEACTATFTLPPPFACNANPRNLRNDAGPQTPGGCVFDTTCTCGSCAIGAGSSGGNTLINSVGVTSKMAQNCGGLLAYLDLCGNITPKGKGGCGDCKGNPVNIASGNKYQSEIIYRAPDGLLALVLFYNSQAGTPYFEKDIFGTHWSTRYTVAVRDSGQSIVAVHRPDGRDLQFSAPASGNTFVPDADIVDKLERLTDTSGNVTGWRFTATANDEVEQFDATGRLMSITTRAGLQQTMTYSTGTTPLSIAPGEGLLISVTDSFARRLSFTYNSRRLINAMTDPAGGTYLFEYDTSGGPVNAGNLSKVTCAANHEMRAQLT